MTKEKHNRTTTKHESKKELRTHSPAMGIDIQPNEGFRPPLGSDSLSEVVAGFSSGTELTENQVVTLARTMFPKVG